eukprot:2125073-Rhodomonas_salina.1
MVQTICAEKTVTIPEGVTVDIKARYVTVKGKRGTLERSFKHLFVDIKKVKGKDGEMVKVSSAASKTEADQWQICNTVAQAGH